MTLDEFRALDNDVGDQNAARCSWVANMIVGQNPRLRRGDDLEGPIGLVLNGKVIRNDQGRFDSFGNRVGPDPTTVCAKHLRFEIRQILNGHPFLDLDAHPVVNDSHNYIHMRTVDIRHAFGEYQVGESIPVMFGDKALVTTLTQEMVDDSTFIMVNMAFSK